MVLATEGEVGTRRVEGLLKGTENTYGLIKEVKRNVREE